MYMRISIPPKDRDCLRILWFRNNDLEGEIVIYHFRVLIFGATSSSAMSSFGMAEMIRVNEINASLETVAIAKKPFYVDDGL